MSIFLGGYWEFGLLVLELAVFGRVLTFRISIFCSWVCFSSSCDSGVSDNGIRDWGLEVWGGWNGFSIPYRFSPFFPLLGLAVLVLGFGVAGVTEWVLGWMVLG